MGLPQILIRFYTLATSAIKRSQRGVVALVLKDDTKTQETSIYRSIDEVVSDDWDSTNYDYIEKTFRGTPSKVIVERLSMSEADDSKALARLANKKVNYIAIPGADETRMQALVSWIKSKRTNDKKTFKAVVANITADDEGIINFTTENIKVGSRTYAAKDYVCRIAGILAGLPFTRSSTNYELPEIESITEHLNPDEDIDNGQLILIFDGEVVKIGRGVNSLTTTSPSKGEKFKKIRVVEAIDLMRDDIKTTWIEMYSGKVNNTYNNKLLFLGAVNAYFKDLQKQEVLDPSFEAFAEIDIESQRIYLQSIGVSVEDMKDQDIKEYPTGDKVFVKAKGSVLDAMEDLDFGMLIA